MSVAGAWCSVGGKALSVKAKDEIGGPCWRWLVCLWSLHCLERLWLSGGSLLLSAPRTGSRRDASPSFCGRRSGRTFRSSYRMTTFSTMPSRPLPELGGGTDSAGDWVQAFHGTWFGGLVNICHPGLGVPPTMRPRATSSTASVPSCTAPHALRQRWATQSPPTCLPTSATIGRCWRLRSTSTAAQRRRRRGGCQWTFQPSAVRIIGCWFILNCGNCVGEDFLREWRPEEEILPEGVVAARLAAPALLASFTLLFQTGANFLRAPLRSGSACPCGRRLCEDLPRSELRL